jgi:hypothetical protein
MTDKEKDLLFDMVSASKEDVFQPFFVDRLMERLSPERIGLAAETFAQSLNWIFRRVALASIVIAVGLAGYNGWAQDDTDDRSALEMAFAVPAVTLDAALDTLEDTIP